MNKTHEDSVIGDSAIMDENVQEDSARNNNAGTNFYIEEGEGMMGENAKTVTELGLKHGRKRKSNPDEWQNKKRKYRKSAEGRELKDPCNC